MLFLKQAKLKAVGQVHVGELNASKLIPNELETGGENRPAARAEAGSCSREGTEAESYGPDR